jgi:hypothetical protein
VLGRPCTDPTITARRPESSAVRHGEGDQTGDAEPVGARAELVAPHLLLERRGQGAGLGQRGPGSRAARRCCRR